jgi:betaine lipid synthase
MNQASMFRAETTPLDYLIDTLDPIAQQTHIRTANYHYYLCLLHRYSRAAPPLYLSRAGFDALKRDAGAITEAFRLHTDSISNVMDQLGEGSLTVWIGMDHMDWYPDPSVLGPVKPAPASAAVSADPVCDLTLSVRALRRALGPGGRAFWRSAAMTPWYAKVFEREGFQVERLSVREVGTQVPIDNVNMCVGSPEPAAGAEDWHAGMRRSGRRTFHLPVSSRR